MNAPIYSIYSNKDRQNSIIKRITTTDQSRVEQYIECNSKSKSVIPILSYNICETYIDIQMEKSLGMSLEFFLKKMKEENPQDLLIEISESLLEFKQSAGLDYNTLSPSKIMLCEEKVTLLPMLRNSQDKNGRKNQNNDYLAPQLKDGDAMGKNAFIWSLGIIFMQIFEAKPTKQRLKQVSSVPSQPHPFESYLNYIEDEQIRCLIRKMLSINPTDRPNIDTICATLHSKIDPVKQNPLKKSSQIAQQTPQDIKIVQDEMPPPKIAHQVAPPPRMGPQIALQSTFVSRRNDESRQDSPSSNCIDKNYSPRPRDHLFHDIPYQICFGDFLAIMRNQPRHRQQEQDLLLIFLRIIGYSARRQANLQSSDCIRKLKVAIQANKQAEVHLSSQQAFIHNSSANLYQLCQEHAPEDQQYTELELFSSRSARRLDYILEKAVEYESMGKQQSQSITSSNTYLKQSADQYYALHMHAKVAEIRLIIARNLFKYKKYQAALSQMKNGVHAIGKLLCQNRKMFQEWSEIYIDWLTEIIFEIREKVPSQTHRIQKAREQIQSLKKKLKSQKQKERKFSRF